jgi:hypothetical protein
MDTLNFGKYKNHGTYKNAFEKEKPKDIEGYISWMTSVFEELAKAFPKLEATYGKHTFSTL